MTRKIWSKAIFHDGQVRVGRAVLSGEDLKFEYLYVVDAMNAEIWMPVNSAPREFLMDAAIGISWICEGNSENRRCETSKRHKGGVCRDCSSRNELAVEKAMERFHLHSHYPDPRVAQKG